MTTFAAGAATDKGRIRTSNQDHFLLADPTFVVADGMGGHQGGEVASEIAVDAFDAAGPARSIDELIEQVQTANRDIVQRARQHPELKGMGTTVCVLADITGAGPNRIGIANVGDSRLYRLTDDGLHQHTEDHSLVEALVRDGRLTRAEAAIHPQRNIVTRALGIDEKVLVDAWELVPVVGDRFVLCSDGLFNEIHVNEISEVLRSIPDPQEAAQDLVSRANAAGGRDNITVVVVDIVEADSVDDALPADRVTDVRKALPSGILTVDQPAEAEVDPGADQAGPEPSSDVAPVETTDVTPPVFTWRLGVMIAAVVVVLVVMLGVFLQIGRSGFTVVEAEDGTVDILQGEGFLWFEPTTEVDTDLVVAQLPALDRERVEAGQEFSSRDEAETYLAYLETLVTDES